MDLTITVTSKIDGNLDNKLTAFGISQDWEKSKSIRNILKVFLALPRTQQIKLLNSCQEE